MNSNVVCFQAYGLLFRSEIALPGYQVKAEDEYTSIDVNIVKQPISRIGINNPTEQGLFFQVNEQELWLHVPNVARFLIQEGTRILIDPEAGIHEDVMYSFLAGPCMAALLMQRNVLVLSGCVLQRDGAAIAYLGDSCTGKSSLAALMAQRGYQIMADNFCVVNNEGLVFPGPSYIELWGNTTNALGISVTENQLIKPRLAKYRISLNHTFYSDPLPLHRIYVLNPLKKSQIEHHVLSGGAKINWLQKNIYNKYYLAGFKKNHLYFHAIARLAQYVPMLLIDFNGVHFNVGELSHYIEGNGA